MGNLITSLTLQSILHLSICTHFCEAFLGILPHFHLFQHFFFLIPVPNSTNHAVVGGCELVLHPETRDEYLAYDLAGKGAECKKFWFHVGNFESSLPERVASAPKSKKAGRVKDLVASKLKAFFELSPLSRTKESLEIMWSTHLLVVEFNLSSFEYILPLYMKAHKTLLGCLQNQWLCLK